MAQAELSDKLNGLAEAIRAHPNPVKAVMCGFDFWLEVMGSGHVKGRDVVAGGHFATGDEPEGTLIVPIMVLGGRIVVSFDPTVPADSYVLKP